MQKVEVDIRLKHPFSMIVAAPSQSGKSHWVMKLIENIDQMSTVPPERIVWAYSEFQPGYSRLAHTPKVELIEGVPDPSDLRDDKRPKLVVLDDLQDECSKTPLLGTLFSRGVHHWNLSVIHVVQNAFYSNMRNARINANYMVYFKSPGDKLGISTLARQLYPKRTQYFMQAFQDATAQPFGYLFVDLTQQCDERFRLRTNVFPDEMTYVYLSRI